MAGKKIWFNGELIPADQAKVSVFDHGLLYGDGVFEGIRVYNGRILKLRSHLKRLFDGARSICLTMPYTIEQLDAATRQTCAANGITDGYIRLCVTRGIGTLGINPLTCKNACTFIIADSIELYPPELYETGMAIITAATIRNHPAALSPRIKSMNYLNNILAKIEAINAGVLEAIMLNEDGYVAECTGDNLFLVRRGVLITPPLHAGVLEGITRDLVLELARAAGLETAETDVTRHDVFTAEEVFLTGTAAELIPVTKVQQRVIGDGEVGPITKQLTAAYRTLVTHAPED